MRSGDASGLLKHRVPGDGNRSSEQETHTGGTEAFRMWNVDDNLKSFSEWRRPGEMGGDRWTGQNEELQNQG